MNFKPFEYVDDLTDQKTGTSLHHVRRVGNSHQSGVHFPNLQRLAKLFRLGNRRPATSNDSQDQTFRSAGNGLILCLAVCLVCCLRLARQTD